MNAVTSRHKAAGVGRILKGRLHIVTTASAAKTTSRQLLRRPGSKYVSVPLDNSNVAPEQRIWDSRAPDQDGQGANVPGFPAAESLSRWWSSIPARTKLVLACSSSFMLSNMDKVNMTVAIIPIAQELGWSSTVSGLVQSSFFWGFLLAQVPGGYISSKFGGHRMLPPSVGVWSLGTMLLPLAATTNMPALCMARSVVGLGEAVAPSAIVDMLARTIPKEQRASAVSTAFSGLHVGSIVGLIMSPAIIDIVGWRTLFVIYGAFGLVWVVAFKMLMEDIGRQEPEVLQSMDAMRFTAAAGAVQAAGSSGSGAAAAAPATMHIPYRAMLRSRPVQALMFTHLAHNWFHYTMLTWLPTYFTDTLSVDLTHAAQTALLPPLAGIVASTVAGRLADKLISSGLPVPAVRKLAQCTAFLVPAALLTALSLSDSIKADPAQTVGCITLALGMSSFSLAGLYCTHQDLSPKYASAMLGLTNTAASLPGVVGVAMVGFLLDNFERSWEVALFAPSALFLLGGAAVYAVAGRNDAIDFDAQDDSPFAWEAGLQGARRMWGSMAQRAASLLRMKDQ